MPTSLPVRLNHDRLHAIETPASFEATGSFPILLHNGDAPVHVHLHLDDALSTVASIPANNHFVDADTTREVAVEVDDGHRPVEGRLKIVTGHGAETDYVTVSIVEPEDAGEAVTVDESLAVPNSGGSAAAAEVDDSAETGGDRGDRGDRAVTGGDGGPDEGGDGGASEGEDGEGDESGTERELDLPDLSPSLNGNAPVVALGLLAVAVAVGAATLSNSPAVLVGALAVFGSIVAAAYLLVRGD